MNTCLLFGTSEKYVLNQKNAWLFGAGVVLLKRTEEVRKNKKKDGILQWKNL